MRVFSNLDRMRPSPKNGGRGILWGSSQKPLAEREDYYGRSDRVVFTLRVKFCDEINRQDHVQKPLAEREVY
jgi:hypothetical protein